MMAASMDARPFKEVERVHRRKGWTQQESAVHGDLVYWGGRYTRILLSEGYRSFSPFATLLEGRCDSFLTRVLIPDMTSRAWEINSIVWGLRPQDYSWALCARYSLPIRDDKGYVIEPEEVAACLGCTTKSYYHRVSRGRKAYEKKLFASG